MHALDEFPLPDWATGLFPIIEQLDLDRTRGKFNPFAKLFTPASTEAADIRAWIKDVGRETGTTPTELANKADLAPSTINKFMIDGEGVKNLNARTLNKIKTAAVAMLDERAKSDEWYIEHEYGIDASGDLPLIHSNPYYLRKIKVISDLYDHGLRVDKELQLNPERMYEIVLPVSRRFIDSTLCALQLNVSDAEEYYGYQDIFVCTPVWKFEQEIMNGDRLVVLERDKYPGQSRMGIRDFLSDPKGHHWLVSPYASNDKFAPIYMGKGSKRVPPEGAALLFLTAGSYHNR